MDRFDSLVHVTEDGSWLNGRADASLARLTGELDRGHVGRACLVGLAGVVRNALVLDCARASGGRLVPIAGFDPSRTGASAAGEIAAFARDGFAGIKLHPRLNGFDPLDPRCVEAIAEATRHGLVVFLDTLFRQRTLATRHAADVVDQIANACPGARLVLLHGGGPALLEVADVVRLHPGLFLDLSFTLLKYAGTSLDADLGWVMRNLDERVVIGSDMPEFTPADAFARAEQLAVGIPAAKWAKVAHGNLEGLFPGRRRHPPHDRVIDRRATSVPAAVDPEIAGKRLLILGAGLWQVEYIRHARRLGVETWVTDWSPTAAGQAEADHFEPIDVTDAEATLAFARRAGIDGVFTAADVGVPTAAQVSAALSLPGYSESLALDATNKLRMRRRSEALGIPCPAFRAVSSVAEAESHGPMTGPVIVKPVDGWSSRGVRFVADQADLGPAVQNALQASRAGQALIEEFLVGTEGSVEALVQDGAVTILGICDKTKSPLPYRYDLELRYPGAYDDAVRDDIAGLATRLAGGFGIVNGIMHIEFLVNGDGRVYLIEFAIRGCGSKVVTHLMPRLTGLDVLRVLIRQAFGLRTSLDMDPPRARHGALNFLLFPPGRVTGVRGLEEAARVPGVIDVCVERGAGDLIADVVDGRSRPGHLLVAAEAARGVQQVIGRVRDLVRLDYEHAMGVAAL